MPFCIFEDENEIMQFVLQGGGPERSFTLVSSRPGFDYTSLWMASCEEDDASYFVCVHYPVSGKKPIPDICASYLVPATYRATMMKTQIAVYELSHRTTLDVWCKSQDAPEPLPILKMLEAIAHMMNGLMSTGHNEMRISPHTIVVESDGRIRLMGVAALDMPWSERCAQTYHQDQRACIPPECTGYMLKKAFSGTKCLYFGCACLLSDHPGKSAGL
jgi:hypothetical protein